jgi:SAM-dependent methyltransferase
MMGKFRKTSGTAGLKALPVAESRHSPLTSSASSLFRPGPLKLAVVAALAVAVVAWYQFLRAEAPAALAPEDDRSRTGPGGPSSSGGAGWLAKKLRTMKKLGVSGSIRRLSTRAEDYSFYVRDLWFDIVHKTDTARAVQLADLDIDSENVLHGGKYAPATSRSFRALMEEMDFPPGSVFVDIGSGKGKTLLLASEYGFKRVVGVEFAGELNEQAKRNWAIYRKGRATSPDFEVVTVDAAKYEIKDDENVFYLFNPFDDVVMNKFIQNIETSLARQPRNIWIIYQNPVNQDVFERHDAYRLLKRFGKHGDTFAVYTR